MYFSVCQSLLVCWVRSRQCVPTRLDDKCTYFSLLLTHQSRLLSSLGSCAYIIIYIFFAQDNEKTTRDISFCINFRRVLLIRKDGEHFGKIMWLSKKKERKNSKKITVYIIIYFAVYYYGEWASFTIGTSYL